MLIPPLEPAEAELMFSAGVWNWRYVGVMAAQPVMTADEWFERMRHAAPPTSDDVTILWDGRRLDSREAVMEWVAEVEAKRAEESAAGVDA